MWCFLSRLDTANKIRVRLSNPTVIHTSDSRSQLLHFGTSSSSSSLKLPVPVLAKIRHHTGHEKTHCEGKIIETHHPADGPYQHYCSAKRERCVTFILTDRKEQQNNDKYAKASFTPIKIIKFGRVAAAIEHWCIQLCGLRTRVT